MKLLGNEVMIYSICPFTPSLTLCLAFETEANPNCGTPIVLFAKEIQADARAAFHVLANDIQDIFTNVSRFSALHI